MRKIAVVPANGIGDALVMLIAAHHLKKLGLQVTVVHRLLPGFGRWLEPGEYFNLPESLSDFSSFDAILLQHNNTAIAKEILPLRSPKLPIYVFYPSYHPLKHGPLLESFDYPFDHSLTMVDNICRGSQALFGSKANMDNGMRPPPSLIHRKYQRRVAIHPTSGRIEKNWPKEKFEKLSLGLQRLGFEPTFIMSPSERSGWPENQSPILPTLEDLASYIYESGYFIGNDSGPGHLASYLSIPHVIIAGNDQSMPLWKPGWHSGEVLTCPRWIPNFKGFRIRENHWKRLITTKGVLNRFNLILK